MNLPTAWPLERYRPLLRLYIRRMQLDRRVLRDSGSSDLIQETYYRAIKGINGCRARTEGEFVAWLRTIVRRVAIDQGRKPEPGVIESVEAAVDNSSASIDRLTGDSGPSPSSDAMNNELRLRLAAAIDELPEEQRDAVILRDLCQESVSDIAAQLGKSERAVAGLLLRGRRRLRELLADLR